MVLKRRETQRTSTSSLNNLLNLTTEGRFLARLFLPSVLVRFSTSYRKALQRAFPSGNALSRSAAMLVAEGNVKLFIFKETEMTKGKVALIGFLMIPVSMILGGLTLSVLWGWFIVTTFGVQALGIAQAIGLAMVVGYFTSNLRKIKWDDDDDMEKKAFRIVTLPFVKAGMFMGIGWIVHFFV